MSSSAHNGVLQILSSNKSWFTTPNPFEQLFKYHRAVRKGPFIFVSGTTALIDVSTLKAGQTDGNATGEGGQSKVHHPTDARKQTEVAMERCIAAVKALGGTRKDVVRVRMYVSRHEDCLAVGEAFRNCFSNEPSTTGEAEDGDFSEVGAAATMVIVKDGFVDPDILVEVEVDAVVL